MPDPLRQSHDFALAPLTRLLGCAGLLPQAIVVSIELGAASSIAPDLAFLVPVIAVAYAAVILSFVGGIWWGLAIRRATGVGQSTLAAVAVVPSLAAAILLTLSLVRPRLALVGLGIALLLTLPVDRQLACNGEAPHGWFRLRMLLSGGLGLLTILASIAMPAPFLAD